MTGKTFVIFIFKDFIKLFFEDWSIVVKNVFKVIDLVRAELVPFAWNVSERVNNEKTELKALDDEFIQQFFDMLMQLISFFQIVKKILKVFRNSNF